MLVIQTPSIGKTEKETVVQPTPRKSGALQMAIMDWNGNCYKPALESLQRTFIPPSIVLNVAVMVFRVHLSLTPTTVF